MRSDYDTIRSLGAEVVVVSFGNKFWVNVWLEQTQAPFPLLLDQERQAYRAYGLEQSLTKSWSLKNLGYYARALLKRERLRGSHGEDTSQLGGDFVVDHGGILRYTHPSQDPTDRPEIAELLSVFKKL